jgi:hypothetical protein
VLLVPYVGVHRLADVCYNNIRRYFLI